jgi:hypothetical protein
MTLLARQALPVSEDDLLTAVVDALRWHGWLVHHDRRSDKALQQGDAGFPDVVATDGHRILVIETKREGARPTADQAVWLAALETAGADVRVLRPSGLDGFLKELG